MDEDSELVVAEAERQSAEGSVPENAGVENKESQPIEEALVEEEEIGDQSEPAENQGPEIEMEESQEIDEDRQELDEDPPAPAEEPEDVSPGQPEEDCPPPPPNETQVTNFSDPVPPPTMSYPMTSSPVYAGSPDVSAHSERQVPHTVDTRRSHSPRQDFDDSVADMADSAGELEVGERLYYIGCGAAQRKREFLQKERESLVMCELSQMADPRITPLGRAQPSRSDEFRSSGVLELYRKRTELERTKKEMQEEAKLKEQTRRPAINPTSKYIVETHLKRRYKGPVSAWEMHRDRFAARYSEKPLDHSFMPNINRSSLGQQRDGEVFTRLHTDALKRSGGKGHEQRRKGDDSVCDPAPSSSVAPTKVSSAPNTSAETVVHRLLSAGQEKQRKHQKMVETHNARSVEQHSFRPQLNKRSVELAEQRKQREEKKKEQEYEEAALESRLQQQNEVSRTAGTRQSHRYHHSSFLTRNYQRISQRLEREGVFERQRASRDLADCTFSPQICRNSEILFRDTQLLQRKLEEEEPPATGVLGASPSSLRGGHSPDLFSTDIPTPASILAASAPNISPLRAGPIQPSLITPSSAASPFDRTAPRNDVTKLSHNFEREISAVLDEWNKIQSS